MKENRKGESEIKHLIRYVCLLLLVLFLFYNVAVSNAETKYEISEEDLAKILRINNRLQVLNQQLTQSLAESNVELEAAKTKLAEFQVELDKLTQELIKVSASTDRLKAELAKAQELLNRNNQDLTKYQQKVENQIRSLKLQRNLAVVVAILALIY